MATQATDRVPQPEIQLTGENHCLLGEDSVRTWYQGLLDNSMLQYDPEQATAVDLLQQLADKAPQLTERQADRNFLDRLFSSKPDLPKGLYIHGTVGRGKTFLMDGFFLNLPVATKLRAHFHGFMRHFHADMKANEKQPDPLAYVTSNLAEKYRIICFDEFHVSDIADAMILGRMVELMMEKNVVLVATSNYAPNDLYPNGLARDRFLPTIKILNDNLIVHNLDGNTDYRSRTLESCERYLYPNDARNNGRFQQLFDNLAIDIRLTPSVKIGSRRINAIKRASTAVWFEFDQLCGGNWSQNDYLALAERFGTIFLSKVPQIDKAGEEEAARRFTWLIDVIYDARVKLLLLADKQLEELFIGEGGESGRTLSRLREMQSTEYLQQAIRSS